MFNCNESASSGLHFVIPRDQCQSERLRDRDINSVRLTQLAGSGHIGRSLSERGIYSHEPYSRCE